MTNFRIVPDVLRERESLGKAPKSELSKALLRGSTVFIPGAERRTWGSLYNLAHHHNKIAKTKRTILNGEEGTLVWFLDSGQ